MSPKLVLDFLWKHKAPICPEGVILQHFKLSTSKMQPLTSFLHGYHCSGTMSALAVNSLLRCQDCVNSFLSICSFPISLLSAISGSPSTPFFGGLWEPSNWSVSGFCPACRLSLLTHGCDDTSLFKCLQWLLLVNTFIFPAWHSRPLSFGTKCSPAFFPTWCLYGSVPSRLGSLPRLK